MSKLHGAPRTSDLNISIDAPAVDTPWQSEEYLPLDGPPSPNGKRNTSASSVSSPPPPKTEQDHGDQQDTVTAKHARRLREEKYLYYIKTLQQRYPDFKLVYEYIKADSSESTSACLEDDECLQCSYFSQSFMGGESQSFTGSQGENLHQPASLALELLERLLLHAQKRGIFRAFVIEDIKPLGMLYIGALLALDPLVFVHYLDRRRSFLATSGNISTLDYPELYVYTPYASTDAELSWTDAFIAKRWGRTHGPLRRLWKAVHGHFQRLIWTRIEMPQLKSGLHLILCESLPAEGSLDRCFAHLPQKTTSFAQFIAGEELGFEGRPTSCFLALTMAIQAALAQNREAKGSDRASLPFAWPGLAQTVVQLICQKWEDMTIQIEEGISGTDAPLSGDLNLIKSVIQRKHLFGYLQRQISGIHQWVVKLPEIKAGDNLISRLRDCDTKFRDWTAQLDQLTSSLLGMLSLSESTRAGYQAVRTKNITVLAFVFIPISTVATCYGMSVTEISGDVANPKMKSFGISAAAVLAGTVAVAWTYIFLFSQSPRSIFVRLLARFRGSTSLVSPPPSAEQTPKGRWLVQFRDNPVLLSKNYLSVTNSLWRWLIQFLDGILFMISYGIVISIKVVLWLLTGALSLAGMGMVAALAVALAIPALFVYLLTMTDTAGKILMPVGIVFLFVSGMGFGAFASIWSYDSTRLFRALKTKEWLWEPFGFDRQWAVDDGPPDQTAGLPACVVM